MNIDSIKNGIVIDHIIKNAASSQMGRKDIIKIDADIEVNLDIIGYVAPNVTINIIRGGELVEKKSIGLPETLVDVIKCKNPRCITSTEQEIKHVFRLDDPEKRVYRCAYCDTKASADS